VVAVVVVVVVAVAVVVVMCMFFCFLPFFQIYKNISKKLNLWFKIGHVLYNLRDSV
jgi:hypothetical protein